MAGAGLIAFALVAASTGPASGAAVNGSEPGEPPATGLSTLEPGSWLRIARGGPEGRDVYEGALRRFDGDTLLIDHDDALRAVALDDVDRVWVFGRASGTAGRVGLVSGALGGTLFGAGIAALCSAYGDDCVVIVPLSAAFFGGAGWLLGRVIGSAVPRWRVVHDSGHAPWIAEASAPPSSSDRPEPLRSRAPVTGSFQLQVGYAVSPDDDAPGGGGGVRAALVAWRDSRVGISPEIALANLGRDERVVIAGGSFRLSTGASDPRRLDLIVGLGAYRWRYALAEFEPNAPPGPEGSTEDVTFLGGSVGALVRTELGNGFLGGIEARFHHNLQHIAQPRKLALVTLMAGLERAW